MDKINHSKFNKKDIPIDLFNRKFYMGAISLGMFERIEKDGNNGHTWRLNKPILKTHASRLELC